MKLIICGPWCTKLFELVINRDKPFKLHISKVNEDGRGAAQPSILTAYSEHTDSTLSPLTVTGWLLQGALGGFIKTDLLVLL